jgi:hypothetical protein
VAFPDRRAMKPLVAVLMTEFLLAVSCVAEEPQTGSQSDGPDTLAVLEEWGRQLGWDVHYRSALAKTTAALDKDNAWVVQHLTDAHFDWLHRNCYPGVLDAKVPHVLSSLCIEQMGGSWTIPCVVWYLRTHKGPVLLTDIHPPDVPGKEEGSWLPAPCQRIEVPPRLAAAFDAIIDDPAAWRSEPEIEPSTGSVVCGVSLYKDGKSYQTLSFGGGMTGIGEEESIKDVFLAVVPIPQDRSHSSRIIYETEQLTRRVLLGPPLPMVRPHDEWLTAFDEAVRATLGWGNTFEAACVNATVPDARYELGRQYTLKLPSEWPRSARYRLFAERMTRELAAAKPQRVARLEWLGPWLDYNCVWVLDGAENDTLLAIGSKLEFGVFDDDLLEKLRVPGFDAEAKGYGYPPDWVSVQIALKLDSDTVDRVFGKLDRCDIGHRFSYICDTWMTGPLYVSWWAKGHEPVQYVVWDLDQKSTSWGGDALRDFEPPPRPEDLIYAWEAEPRPDWVTLCDRIPDAERTRACEAANAIRNLFEAKMAELGALK